MAEEERFGFSAINASRCLCSALRARAAEKHGAKNASRFLNALRISSDDGKKTDPIGVCQTTDKARDFAGFVAYISC